MSKIKIFLCFISALFLISIPTVSFAAERLYSGEASIKIGGADVAKTIGSVLKTDLNSLFSGTTSISIGGTPVAKSIAMAIKKSFYNSYLYSGDATLTIGGQVVSKSTARALIAAAIKIFGDVYFKDDFNGLGISAEEIGVAASGGRFFLFDPPVKFEQYSIAFWDAGAYPSMKNADMQNNFQKLEKEAYPIAENIFTNRILNLNPNPDMGGVSLTNLTIDEYDLDGKVWIWRGTGEFILDNVNFIGKGTIIIEKPADDPDREVSLKIGSDLPPTGRYLTCADSCGFIIKNGPVRINKHVSEVNGVYFVPNHTFYTNEGEGGSGLEFTGSIVAKGVDINKTRPADLTGDNAGFSLVFNYDPRIVTNPPPGFSKIVGLTWDTP